MREFPRFLLSEASGLPRAVQGISVVTTVVPVVLLIVGAANPWLWVSVIFAGLLFAQGWDGYTRWKLRQVVRFQEPAVLSYQHLAPEIPGGATETAHFLRACVVNEGSEDVRNAHGTLTVAVEGQTPKTYAMRWTGSDFPKGGVVTSALLKKDLTPNLPEQLDVAVTFNGSAYVWNNESLTTGYRDRDRQIDAMEFVVTVRVRASGGIDISQRLVVLALQANVLVRVLNADEPGFNYKWFDDKAGDEEDR
jgi:hypothetical protein